MKAKGGNKYAIKAMAGKIAKIYYKMITQKEVFKPVELSAYQEKFKLKKIAYLERKLASLKVEAACCIEVSLVTIIIVVVPPTNKVEF
jgi:transposase